MFLQLMVDLGDRRDEPVGVDGEQFLDAGEWHACLGEHLDLDQGSGVLGTPRHHNLEALQCGFWSVWRARESNP